MSFCRWQVVIAAVLAMTLSAPAQQFVPRIGYVFPAGGQQGQSFQVTAGGQYLQAVSEARVSGNGVKATVIEYSRPLTPKEFNLFRDQLKELLAKKAGGAAAGPAWTDADEKKLAEVRKKLSNPPRRQGNPAIAETVKLQITIDADAAPGERELRLRTPAGLTAPLVFCVGQLPEVIEQEWKRSAAPTETRLTLPATVDGQIMPGDVDRYRFRARKGQRLVAVASARRLIPYLADAVPGWFQATLAIYDSNGRELAYDDDFRFDPDPALCCVIPADGDYVVEIKDAIYRGREDFVYRISLGELPFVTSVFPLGARAGTQTPVELTGWNLPATRMVFDARGHHSGIDVLQVRSATAGANFIPFAVDTLPEMTEREPNDQPASAQPVTLPVIINGRIDRPGDWDLFRFEGRAGQEVVAEVIARRLNSPLDSMLILSDASGRQIAFNDDHEDKGEGLITHKADSWLSARLPETGTYFLRLGDTQQKGGAEYGYRLRISAPEPDFAMRVVPSSISIRGGASAVVTVYALRHDGFAGPIALSLADAPAGVTLSGAVVPAGQDRVQITIAAASALKEPVAIRLEGRGQVRGRTLVHPAIPAEDMMQAFLYRHLVPADELLLTATGRWGPRSVAQVLSRTPVRLVPGQTARLQVVVPAARLLRNLHLELSDPPEGISILSISATGGNTQVILQCDAKAKVGLSGNLILEASAERPARAAGAGAQNSRRRTPLGTLPAIPFEITSR